MKAVKGLRWAIVSMVALATVVNYIDRNALAVMWPGMSEEMGLGKEDYALVLSFFMVSYAFGQSLFGKLFDVLGTRFGFLLSIGVWSISIALHSLVNGVASLAIVRFFLGLGEAGNWPGATKANAEWFPVNERALAQGIFNSGASIGAIVSAPLVAIFYVWIGWKATFILIGLLGVVWMVPWYIIYKAGPDAHPWITPEEREYILSGQRKDIVDVEVEVDNDFAPGWLEMLRYKETWSVILSRFFLDPVWWLFVSWLPIYLADQFGFDVKQIGMFAWVPYVGAAIGSVFGGWLSGRLIRRGWSVNAARKTAIVLGAVVMLPSLLFTAVASTPLSAVLLIALILFGFQVAIGNIQTLPSDFYSGKSVGSLAGLGGTAAVLGVLITIWLVPVMTKESYIPFFVMGAALVPMAIIPVLFLARKIGPVQQKK
ncbi:Hexuronate transporter [Zhongshania aliphaticivorans]|uniref:Hexuronate transporter n=1 Tax=Zhongshania aliphaticivorans TaxID=1470434 RepID=A0A5S9NLH5_9GAMM|nr:MFS transporter [Zhongshania aliphaticivorans]CAA0090862.1 Hexuronate transporter [Zhongshania aliphaticivorans]CAA0098357.1 Hexuronate transporter [Zhongshania aliphaticivorans]